MSNGALVWVVDRRGSMFMGKVVDPAPIKELEDRTEYMVVLWRRARGAFARIAAPWLVVRELTAEERVRAFRLDAEEPFEAPTLEPIGNLRDVLERVSVPQGWRSRGRKAVG